MSAESLGGSPKSKIKRFLEHCQEERVPEEGFTVVDAAAWLLLHDEAAEDEADAWPESREEEPPAA